MAIAPGDMTTNKASLAGMPGINVNHSNTAFNSFILNKVTELPEGPGVLNLTLFLSNLNPVTDMF